MEETDVLGPPYTVETFVLRPDDEGAVEANLVRLRATEPTGGAVLYVHGFCDYFFQTEFAQWWADRGWDFYALDLRKYGRSLRDHQTPGYIEDVSAYFEELDLAWEAITARDGHDRVMLSAHSTGGLIGSLWADDRDLPLAGTVLNSPWVDMHGPFWLRLGSNVVRQLGGYQPRREIPRSVNPWYGHALHRSFEGEWDYDLDWKPLESWPIYVGWLRAIRRAHGRLHRGLSLSGPVLVLTSGRTGRPKAMDDEVWTTDIVLDVNQMRRWATQVGAHVTVVSVEGAIHDVVLSRPEPRARVYDELDRWLSAYVEQATVKERA
ncbi:alpha/beta hydrolase [Nocardioides sp.]|uniref:alpha/beta hydrolase n=1 Tax=Nocardioides sp. TaxID=35761 RepID=UPI00352968B6